ncbi:hypothetical protein [Amycolatopsis anabasis]|uniref:hypothetical protein n=1 Tax=Amycolatopsis anabasis TaxID=1840409 RepID=UPI00131CEE16|nr:hypothetical protein [Amycolatopsis anabasis]
MAIRIIERTRHGQREETRVLDLPHLSVELIEAVMTACPYGYSVTPQMAIDCARRLRDLHTPYQFGWTDWVRVPTLDHETDGKA